MIFGVEPPMVRDRYVVRNGIPYGLYTAAGAEAFEAPLRQPQRPERVTPQIPSPEEAQRQATAWEKPQEVLKVRSELDAWSAASAQSATRSTF